MHRTSDLGICLCALLCAGYGEGRLADHGHMTIDHVSIGSLVGQVLCMHRTVSLDGMCFFSFIGLSIIGPLLT